MSRDWRNYSDEQWMRLGNQLLSPLRRERSALQAARTTIFHAPIVLIAACLIAPVTQDVPKAAGVSLLSEELAMKRMAVSVAASMTWISCAAGQNLLTNGGLEGSLPAACNGFTTLPGGSTAIPGWRVVGPRSIDWGWENATDGSACCDSSPEGHRTIDLNGSPAQDGGAIDQTIATTPGKRYRISFLALANGCCAPLGTAKTMRVTTGAVASEHTLVTQWGSASQTGTECDWTSWTRIEREWVADAATTLIELRSLVLANAGGILVDDISVVEAGPRDLHVPSEYATVTAAVAASMPGDRVVIAPGIYPWSQTIVPHSLTIEGAGGAMSTRFEGAPGELRTLFELQPGVGSIVTVRNLHIDRGGGLHATSGSLSVERCMFTRNVHGLLAEDLAGFQGAMLTECAFVGNGGPSTEQAGGVGVYVLQGAPGAALDSCMFLDNRAQEGGAWHVSHSASSAVNCLFARNSALLYSGGAIARWWGHVPIPVENCSFVGNTAAWSGTQNWNCCVSCAACSDASAADTVTDCNGNLIPDSAELLVDPALDLTADGILDACQAPPCFGDVDQSGAVNGIDLAIVLQNWGIPSPKYPEADIDGDGAVNGSDLALVLSTWGTCP